MRTDIYQALERVPRNVSVRELENWYIILTLTRNAGNRTRSAAEIGMKLRTLRKRLVELRGEGYTIPPYINPRMKLPK